jgi:glycosyltransferase involved in cell wall biosynthesis
VPDILFVLHRISPTGSPYNEFALAWHKKHQVSVCTYFKPELTVPEEITLYPGDNTIWGFWRALNQAMAAQQYDIIHLHYPHTAVLMLLSNIHRWPTLLPRTVYTVHSSYPNYKLRNRMLMLPVFALLRRIVCCSQSSYNSLPTLYKRLSGSRLSVVQNGINLDRIDTIIQSLTTSRSSGDPFKVISVGRLIPVKNPLQIVLAFKQGATSDARLVMIGQGPLHSELEATARDLRERVTFTGMITREQVYRYLANADLFVSTSWVEGLPIAVMEAMACGCAVILSDIPAHREIAEGADFIPLISPGETERFARAIAEFQQMTPTARHTIGQQCRELIRRNFSLDLMHAGYEAIYAEITR